MSLEQIAIELVYALPEEQTLMSLHVDQDSTVEQAITESGILLQYPVIDLTINKVGIWNKATKLTQVLEDGDRIEIYRPLIADPKEVRKRRAEKAKEEGRADKVTGGRVNPQRTT
ncbi:RnfH family protein [Colwelliaceae bacterium BS250]